MRRIRMEQHHQQQQQHASCKRKRRRRRKAGKQANLGKPRVVLAYLLLILAQLALFEGARPEDRERRARN